MISIINYIIKTTIKWLTLVVAVAVAVALAFGLLELVKIVVVLVGWQMLD